MQYEDEDDDDDCNDDDDDCNDAYQHFMIIHYVKGASLIAQLVKNLPAMWETLVQFLGQEDPLEKGLATHSSILGLPWWLRLYRIGLQCRRLDFDPWVGKIPWRRAWQPTPVFLPGESPWTEQPGGL